MGLALRLRPEVVQVLFATAADAPPGQWEAVAAAIAPTRAQRTTIRQLWHAYAGQVQALRQVCRRRCLRICVRVPRTCGHRAPKAARRVAVICTR